MADDKKNKDVKESNKEMKEIPREAAPAPTVEKATQPAAKQLPILVDRAKTTYANLARVTGTPEEVILDLALNPNAFGQVLDENISVDHRIVMSYAASKRLLLVLNEVVRRYEERFGHIEIDVNRRLRKE